MPRYIITTHITGPLQPIQWAFLPGGPLYSAVENPGAATATLQTSFDIDPNITDEMTQIQNDTLAESRDGRRGNIPDLAPPLAQADFQGFLYGVWQQHKLSVRLQTTFIAALEAAPNPVNDAKKEYYQRIKKLVDDPQRKSNIVTKIKTEGGLDTETKINTEIGNLDFAGSATRQQLANKMRELGMIVDVVPPGAMAPAQANLNDPEVLELFAEREFHFLLQATDRAGDRFIFNTLLENKELIKAYLKTLPGHTECNNFLNNVLRARGNANDNPDYAVLELALRTAMGTLTPDAGARIESMALKICAEGHFTYYTGNLDTIGLAADWPYLRTLFTSKDLFVKGITSPPPPICKTRAEVKGIIDSLKSGNLSLDQFKTLMAKLGIGGSPVQDAVAKQLFAEVQYQRLVRDLELIPAGYIRTQLTVGRAAEAKAAILAAVIDPATPITTPAGINKLVKDVYEAKGIDDLKQTVDPTTGAASPGPLAKLGLVDWPLVAAAEGVAREVFADNVIRTLMAAPPAQGALPLDSPLRTALDPAGAVIVAGAGGNYRTRLRAAIIQDAQIALLAPGDFECKTVAQGVALVSLTDPAKFNILATLTPAQLLDASFPPPPHPDPVIPQHPGYLRALGLMTTHVAPVAGSALGAYSADDKTLAKKVYAEIQFERELKRIEDATPRAERPSAVYRTLKSKKTEFINAIALVADGDPIFTPAPDDPAPPAPLIAAPVGSLRELFDNIYGDRPRAGAAPAPEGKDLNGNGGILHAMQVLGLAGGALGAQGGVPAAQAAADLKNAEVFFKQAQFNRLVRELKESHRAGPSITIAGLDPTIQADLITRANTGALSDSLDDLLIRKKSTPGRNFLQRLGVVNTTAAVDGIRDNQFRDLRDETKSTADIAGLMDGLQLIAANDPNLAEVKQQFADVQFRWLVKKAAQEQSDRRVATFPLGQNLYEMLAVPQTRDALKRFLMNFTTHAEVENFYKMLSTKKGDELRIYLLSVLRDGTPAEKMTLTATVMRAVTSLPYFQPSVSNNEYLDLIENPFIREMLRKRGDYFGKNDALIKSRIAVLNQALREEKRVGALTHVGINTALGRLFRDLMADTKANPSAPPATYGETVGYKGGAVVAVGRDDLIVNGGADIAGPPEQFDLNLNRSMPILTPVALGGAGVTTLNDMQTSINEFFTKFATHTGLALPDLNYNTLADRTRPQNILLRDILIRRGLREGNIASNANANNEWHKLRNFDWAHDGYSDLLNLIRPILHADDRAKSDEQILSEQEFQRIKAYQRNRDMQNQDDAKQMMKEWADISTPKPSYNPYKSSFERVGTLLSVIDSQVSRIRGAYPIDGSQPDLKVCLGLDLKVEKENREKSLIEVNELIRIYELRLEEQKARHKLFFEDLKSALLDHGALVNEQQAIIRLRAAPHNFSEDHARKVYKTIREGSATLDALRQSTERTLDGLKERRDALTVMETQLSSIEALIKSMKDSKEYVIEALVSDPLELKGATYTAQLDEISQYIATRRGEVEHDHLAAAVAGPTTARRQGVEFKKPIVSFTRSLTAIVDIAMGDSKYATQETRFYTADSKSELSSISKSMASKLLTMATGGGGNPDLQDLIQAITGVAHTDGTVLKKLTTFFRNYESHLTKDLIDLNLLQQFLMTAIAEKGGDPAHVQTYDLHQELYDACVSDVANDKCIQIVDGVQRPSRKLCEEAWIAVNHYFDTHPGATELPIASASNRVFGVALKQAFILYESIHRKENAAKGIKLHCTDKSGLMYEAPKTRWFSLDVFKTEQEYFRSHFNPIIKASHDPRAKIRAAEKRTEEAKKQSEVLTDVEQHRPTRPRVR